MLNVEGGMTRKRRASAAGRCALHSSRVAGKGRHPQSALTLIELLVVLAILSILVGSAIPVLSPASDDRRIREAARGVNVFLAGAQTRAVETGRPFGVRLKKLSQDTGNPADNAVSLELSYVEQPPPFAGFDDNALVMFGSDQVPSGPSSSRHNPNQVLMRFVTRGNVVNQSVDNLPPGFDPDLIPPGLFQPGDIVEVNGRSYRMVDDANMGADLDGGFYVTNIGNPPNSLFVAPLDGSSSSIRFAYDDDGLRLTNPLLQPIRFWTEPQPYQIHRQPTPTSNEPFELPEGTAIDLRASGIGDAPFYEDDEFNGATPTGPGETRNANGATTSNGDPVHILFSPDGTIERVQFNTGLDGGAITTSATTDTLFLLVGLRENAPASNAAADTDFGDPSQAGAGEPPEIEERKAEINWLNGDTRWVTVGARTGTVLTAENAFVDPVVIGNQTTPVNLTTFPASLTARRNLEILRARELARNRSQDSGR